MLSYANQPNIFKKLGNEMSEVYVRMCKLKEHSPSVYSSHIIICRIQREVILQKYRFSYVSNSISSATQQCLQNLAERGERKCLNGNGVSLN